MIRTQILLYERQYEALKSRARREGRSLSDVVRRAVSAMLGDTAPSKRRKPRIEDIFGLYCDPNAADVARNHDKYLYRNPCGGS